MKGMTVASDVQRHGVLASRVEWLLFNDYLRRTLHETQLMLLSRYS